MLHNSETQPEAPGNSYKIEKEAADYVRLSPRTLQRHRQQGTGPLFTKAGHRVLYRQSDLDDWLSGNVFRSTSEAGHPNR